MMATSVIAQDKTTLESKRKKLLDEIRYTEKLLNKTKSDAQSTSSDIATLKHKIHLREQLVSNLKSEVRTIGSEVAAEERAIDDLNDQLVKLKENYSKSVYNAYKYQKTNQQILFILGAEDMNQAVRRLNYLRKLNDKRKEQAHDIRDATEDVKKKVAELQSMMEEKKALLSENNLQMKSLESERSEKDKYIARLKKNEKNYRAEINKKDGEAKKLEREIRLIIERELAAAAAAAKGNSTDEFELTPAAIAALSKEFYNNKGKLPWPVEKGYVSSRFGKQSHPEIANLQINNTGIDIRTGKDAPVRAIFGGEVVSVFSNPTFKNAIIIKHGDYFTVYTKLGSVKVKRGDKIKTNELIGYAYTEGGQSEVHLEVWKGKTNLDPYTWIARK